MKPIEIFSEFICKELDGDIQKLLDYDLNDKEMLSRFPAPPSISVYLCKNGTLFIWLCHRV